MQVNTLFQGMLGIGTPGAGQGTSQGLTPEEAAQQFEDMLLEQSQQNRQEAPAPKKETADAPEKPAQEAQPAKPVDAKEEGTEVAAGLVTSQPVVFFEVVNVEENGQPVQVVDPMAGMAEQAPVVQEAMPPAQPQQPVEVMEQPVAEAPAVEAGFREELQQVPVVEDQPEAQQAEVETEAGQQPVEHAEVRKAEAAPQEPVEDVRVKDDVEVEAQPVFHRETESPVKVGENYEPVAPEEPEAPKQIMDRVVQMLNQGESRVELALTPGNLGAMTIEITRLQDGALHIVLGAVSQKATALLQQNSAELHGLLAAGSQGEVHIEVQQQEPQQQANPFMNPDEQGRQQPQQQHNKPQQQAETEDFVRQLRLGLVEKEEE